TFLCWGGPDETGFQTLNIGYRLFSAQLVEKQGVQLWSMNQPLLEKALRKWEQQTGQSINVVEGNSPDLSLYRHGFSKPAPTAPSRSPTPPPPRPAAPTEDLIPDLEDLKL
ncbi:MAG: hypothetical protein HYV03_06040, partial [Deltaproteobacteria bacterium]|nr:hypothetical protein [Deltaproteobacteria bacterium]